MTNIMFSVSEWATMQREGKGGAHNALALSTTLITKYWRIPGPDTAQRLTVLEEIKAQASKSISNAPPISQAGAKLMALALQAEKQIQLIRKGIHGWTMMRDKFGTFGGDHSRRGLAAHVGGIAARPMVGMAHLLEKWDPQHRFFHDMRELDTYLDQWLKDLTGSSSFITWLGERGHFQKLREPSSGVKYLDPSKRWEYEWHFAEGKILQHFDDYSELGKYRNFRALSTNRNQANELWGVAIWVCDRDGNFYSGDSTVGAFHHSSFLAGAHVVAAGELIALNGKLLYISNSSGHYSPSRHQLFKALQLLVAKKVNIDGVVVWLEDSGIDVPVADFMQMSGSPNFQYCVDYTRTPISPWSKQPAPVRARDMVLSASKNSATVAPQAMPPTVFTDPWRDIKGPTNWKFTAPLAPPPPPASHSVRFHGRRTAVQPVPQPSLVKEAPAPTSMPSAVTIHRRPPPGR